VKNSADHGLESSERRAELGKPLNGTITLSSYMRDGSAIVEISDDGKGIDKKTIASKALELGLVTENELSSMSDKDILALIYEQGMSTSEKVTNLSGRGVGMNIVKTNIEKLKGTIEIESEPDMGTTIRLKLPLTLSVIRSLIVTVDGVQYAVPDINVERLVRLTEYTKSKRIERVNKSLVLVLDGMIIPIVTMDEIDARVKGMKPLPAKARLDKSVKNGITKCLVLKSDGYHFAILIDDALDTEQILLKPLPIYLQNCPCYSNVTVLGSGKAVAILDATGILRYMQLGEIAKEASLYLRIDEEIQANESESGKDENIKQVIVFKCSGPEYFAVETNDISRIEAIRQNDIQDIGKGRFVTVSDRTVRLIRPEDYSPVRKKAYTEEKLYMITLKSMQIPIGFLVQKVIDKYEDVFTLDDKHFHSNYINGTSTYNDRIIIFLNTASIAEAVENDRISKAMIKKRDVI
jgi:two-component system chemotaxis sensor kinase CheA